MRSRLFRLPLQIAPILAFRRLGEMLVKAPVQLRKDQYASLADMIQGALMLRYNKRHCAGS